MANTLDRAKADMRIDDQSHECLLTFVNTLSQYDEKTISVSTLYQSYLPTVELSEVTPGEMGNDDHLDFGQSEKLSESLTDAEMLNKSDANTNPSDTTDQRHLKENISNSSEPKKLVNGMMPLLLLFAGIFSITFIYKQCSSKETVQTPLKTEVKELTRAEDDINPLAIDQPTKIFDNPRLEKYRHVLTNDILKDGCKIAVGSFKDERNAISMMERVLAEGFNSEILTFEGGSRVIISFDCLSEDLDDYLVRVKEYIAPNAWYLQPIYEPEEQ